MPFCCSSAPSPVPSWPRPSTSQDDVLQSSEREDAWRRGCPENSPRRCLLERRTCDLYGAWNGCSDAHNDAAHEVIMVFVQRLAPNRVYSVSAKNVLKLQPSPSGRASASDDETCSAGTLRQQARLLEKFRGPGSNQSRSRSGAAKVTFGAVGTRSVEPTARTPLRAQLAVIWS